MGDGVGGGGRVKSEGMGGSGGGGETTSSVKGMSLKGTEGKWAAFHWYVTLQIWVVILQIQAVFFYKSNTDLPIIED